MSCLTNLPIPGFSVLGLEVLFDLGQSIRLASSLLWLSLLALSLVTLGWCLLGVAVPPGDDRLCCS